MKRVLTLILAVSLLSSFSAGCNAPAKKPSVNRGLPMSTTKLPTTSPELHKLATKLASEASRVKGVKKATVALSGSTAYVGLDIPANVEASKTKTIKRDVVTRVKKADKRLATVLVSTDVGLVTRIKKVGKGIEQGKPITSFANELKEIGRRITP